MMDGNGRLELETKLCLTSFDETNQQIKVSIEGDDIFAEDLVMKVGLILVPDEENEKKTNWLQHNSDCTIEVKKMMAETAANRHKWIKESRPSVREIMERYPRLLDPGCIEQDFLLTVSEGAADQMFTRWPNLAERLIYYAASVCPRWKETLQLDEDMDVSKLTKGLQENSVKYFGIFEGLHTPVRKFSCVDKIAASAKGLTFQKWCFDLKREQKVLLRDPVALQLLCAQAHAGIQHGSLKPNAEQLSKIEEHCGPWSAAPVPYITECQRMPGYTSVTVAKCVLFQEFRLQSIQFPVDTQLVLSAAKRGMLLQINNTEYFISWRKMKSWSRAEDNLHVTMVIYSVTSDSYADMCIKSHQAHYLVAVVMEMIKLMQTELKGPVFQTSDLKRNRCREIIEWNNITFSTTCFNAEREAAVDYIDISTIK